MAISRNQLILLSFCLALLTALWFANIVKPREEAPPAPIGSLDIKSISARRVLLLSQSLADSVRMLEELLIQNSDISTLATMASIWQRTGNNSLSALYLKQLAQKTMEADRWEEAGDQFQLAFRLTQDSTIIDALVAETLASYEEALKIEPGKASVSISLANCYLERTTEAMKGVTLLLGVLDKDSNDIKANLILGKWGIFSGQYVKASKRLEKVVTLAPENMEAYYNLGQAYQGMGDKNKALEMFEKCKEMSDHPAFVRNIEKLIDNIRNS